MYYTCTVLYYTILVLYYTILVLLYIVYVGERFRLKAELPESTSNEDVARYIIKYIGILVVVTGLSNVWCVFPF